MKNQIVLYSRHTAGLVRIAKRSRQPGDLLASIRQRLARLWDEGCHSNQLSAQDKETCRRCFVAISAMLT